jgi:hypothetical protein
MRRRLAEWARTLGLQFAHWSAAEEARFDATSAFLASEVDKILQRTEQRPHEADPEARAQLDANLEKLKAYRRGLISTR